MRGDPIRATVLSVQALPNADPMVERLNRLSSCVYILYCRKVAGYAKGGAE